MIQYKKIEDICSVIAGQSPPSSSYNQEKNGVPFFQGKADFNEKHPSIRYWCNEPKKISQPNDILISVRAPVGAININNIKSCIGRGLAAIRCGEDINLDFLFHYLRFQQKKIEDLGTGSTFKAITIKTLKSIKIPLPPLKTQKQIASILNDAQALIQKTKQVLSAYDQLAQSIFLDMFGDPVTNPKEWEMKTLKSITKKIGSGATPRGGKDSYKKEGMPLIRSLNIHDNYFKKDNLAFIDAEQAKKLDNVSLEKNDVLFNITGASVARCAIVPSNCVPGRVNQHVSILRPKDEKLNSTFLLHLIISPNSKSKLLGVGKNNAATRESITKIQLEEFEIIVPPLTLQSQFAEKIELIEQQKELAKKELKESEDLFQALLQKAFKGELIT
ncbi:MAG: restriction endonuclease subunit S [Brumimicrobium sp.]